MFEAIEREATEDVDSDYLSINFFYNDGEFISSKFIPNSSQKNTQKTKFVWFEHCLELFGWQMPYKFEPLSLKLLGCHLLLNMHIFLSDLHNVLLFRGGFRGWHGWHVPPPYFF